jgi:hypothetical protein
MWKVSLGLYASQSDYSSLVLFAIGLRRGCTKLSKQAFSFVSRGSLIRGVALNFAYGLALFVLIKMSRRLAMNSGVHRRRLILTYI